MFSFCLLTVGWKIDRTVLSNDKFSLHMLLHLLFVWKDRNLSNNKRDDDAF